jgi:hypothetical protein
MCGGVEIPDGDDGVGSEPAGGGIAGGLFAATLLMIVFRQHYPRLVV